MFLTDTPILTCNVVACIVHSDMEYGSEWKVLPRSEAVAQFPLLYATLSPQGSIVISRSTHEKLGSPAAYVVMFDPLRHRLGLHPESSDNPNSYPARKQGRSGAKIIRAHRMIREFGIQPPDTLLSFLKRRSSTKFLS